jgi:hypothetical protein
MRRIVIGSLLSDLSVIARRDDCNGRAGRVAARARRLKTHLATALGVEACGRGKRVRFFQVTELVAQLMEAREEWQSGRLRSRLAKLDLLILDELGYVPASKAGAELLFDVIGTAYELD